MQHGGARSRRDLGDVLHIVGKLCADGVVGEDGVAVFLRQLAIGHARLRAGAFVQHRGEICRWIQAAQDGEAMRAEEMVEIIQPVLAEHAIARIDAENAFHALWRA